MSASAPAPRSGRRPRPRSCWHQRRCSRSRSNSQIVAVLAAGALPPAGLTLQAALLVDDRIGAPQTADAHNQVSFDRPATGSTWAVVARAVAGGATGPWSASVVVPAAAPALTGAVYDGATLHVTWTGDAACEYLVTVVTAASAGRELARTRAAGSSASVALDAGAGAANVVLRQVVGVTLGPAAQLPLVLAGCPATALTAAAGDTATVSWPAPSSGPTPTAFVPVLCWEGSERQLADQPANATSFAVPLSGVPAGAAVGVRTRAGAALGPLANLAPVVLGRPTDVAVSWSEGTISVSWSAPEDPRIDGALITLTPAHGAAVLARVAACEWSALLTADAGAGATVSVAAVAGTGVGAPCDPVAVIVAPPTLTKLGWDGVTVSATWTAPSQPSSVNRYELVVHDAGVVVASAVFAGTSAALAVPAAAAGARAATVAARAPGSSGPASQPLALPAAGSELTDVSIDPVTGKATVSWSPTGGTTTGYLVQSYRAGLPAGPPLTATAAATSVELPVNPAAYDDLELALAVTATAGSVATTGPFGPRLRIPTDPVQIRDVDFDGATLRVSWDPVPGASGYALAVVDGLASVGHAQVAGTETSARFAVTLGALTLPYEAVVQPSHGASNGIRATAPLFTPGLYVRPATTAPPAPARILRATKLALEPEPITAYLPDLGPLTGLPIAPPQSGADGVPFTLAAAPAAAAPMKYMLTLDNGALRFDTHRATLADAYRLFLSTVEENQGTPRGILALQQTIARLMPQTLEETLYYSYGLSPQGFVDLRPGMVLRVAFSSFDLTAVSGAPQWSTGYTAGPVVDYDVGEVLTADGSGWLVGFDAFIDWLVTNGALTVPAPQIVPPQQHDTDVVETGGADAADLSFPFFPQPFYRLLIPTALQAPTPPAVSRTGQQFTLAAAPKWKQIDAAGTVPGGGLYVAYFRGRAVARACIRVEIDGAVRTVPIGTTVGNALEQLARRPPSAPVSLRGLRLERAPGPVILTSQSGYQADAITRVRLDWNGIVSWPPAVRDALNLPLLHGDRLVFGEPP